MTALPAGVVTGLVTGLFTKVIGDTAVDPDVEPDVQPMSGRVVFTPNLAGGRMSLVGAVPPATVVVSAVTAGLDSGGALSMRLVAGGDQWTWTVTFFIKGLTIAPFSFWLAEGATVDLTMVAPVPAASGVPAPPLNDASLFSVTGESAPLTGMHRIYNDTDRTMTIVKVRASVGVSPAGSALVVDLLKNGISVFAGDNPTVVPGSFTGTGIPAVTLWEVGSYLTVDVLFVGSDVPGSNLTVSVITS